MFEILTRDIRVVRTARMVDLVSERDYVDTGPGCQIDSYRSVRGSGNLSYRSADVVRAHLQDTRAPTNDRLRRPNAPKGVVLGMTHRSSPPHRGFVIPGMGRRCLHWLLL